MSPRSKTAAKGAKKPKQQPKQQAKHPGQKAKQQAKQRSVLEFTKNKDGESRGPPSGKDSEVIELSSSSEPKVVAAASIVTVTITATPNIIF